ncbi:MAG: TonB family protein [Bryobacterales bacterium]|nr:TonB family protein [Bryobacterales bacterium]
MAATVGATESPILRSPSVPDSQILRKVEPVYPARALELRIEGVVRFTTLVGTDGRVLGLRLLSGHPLLVHAAARAARRWVFRRGFVGEQPAQRITVVEVPFRLPEKAIAESYDRTLSNVNDSPK